MTHHRDTESTENTEEADGKALTHTVIGAAIEVHRSLGPGLLESIYESGLCRELWLQGINYERQVVLPIHYKGARLDHVVRLDLIIDRRLIVEVKASQAIEAIHRAQLLTYLKLSRLRLGLLINFNVQTLRSGIRRIVNG